MAAGAERKSELKFVTDKFAPVAAIDAGTTLAVAPEHSRAGSEGIGGDRMEI
jgi:hypothetical protein